MLFLVVVGFGLVFSYVRRLVWSSIGFSLLITCLTIELYFLMNAFWTKVDIGSVLAGQGTPTWNSLFEDNKTFRIYLANFGLGATVSGDTSTYGATLTGAIQAALANVVAYSAILGKAGPLEAWFVALFGTFGFVLNKKLIYFLGLDYGGSFSIFTFGGFMGLFMGIMLNCAYRGENRTGKNKHYTGNHFSVALSLMGNLIVWVLFPILTMDPESQIRVGSTFQLYTVPLNILLSIAGSTVMAVGLSSMINHTIAVRDIVQAPTAGAVAVASAAYYITNPVYAIVIGSVAGLIQTGLQTMIEKPSSRKNHNVVNTFSFIVFGVQGIFASVFASGFRHALETQTDGLTVTVSEIPEPIFGFVIGVISAGIGILFGLLIGVFLIIFARHERDEHFHDFTYWMNDDGIRYDIPITEESIDSSSEVAEIYIKETVKDIKMKHAYL